MATPLDTPSSLNEYLSALQYGGWIWYDGDATDGTTIKVFIAAENFDLQRLDTLAGGEWGVSQSWEQFEVDALNLALQQWSNVADIHFEITGNYAEADLVEFQFSAPASTLLGRHDTPYIVDYISGQPEADGTGWGLYNVDGPNWNAAGLARGGEGFFTLIHELGHALGLAHPFDTGLNNASTLFPGVTNDDDLGDNALNQGIFTIMSYFQGWHTHPSGATSGATFGNTATPMAFDIAAIQYLYGANMDYKTGNDVYYLPSANGPGTFWECIWDAGGIDTIAHFGFTPATIDLRPATLDNSPTGGGVVSFARGIYGGFTIANDVVIENAFGGSGADVIRGNDAHNFLAGGLGNDLLFGGVGNDYLAGDGGTDTIFGDAGIDEIEGNGQRDVLFGGVGNDDFNYFALSDSGKNSATRDSIRDFTRGQDDIDLRHLDASTRDGGNQSFRFIADREFSEKAGELRFEKFNRAGTNRDQTIIEADVNGDGRVDFSIELKGLHNLTAGDFFL
jgi:serralysin